MRSSENKRKVWVAKTRAFRASSRLARVSFVCLCFTSPIFQAEVARGADTGQLGSRARDQIRMLCDEKAGRTPALRKLDSQLVYALRQKRHEAALAGLTSLRPSLAYEPDGRLLVDILAEVVPELLKAIQRHGGFVVNSFPRHHAIRALLSLETAELLATQPEVHFIRPAARAATSTISEGAIAHRADAAWNTFLIDGAGVKVGVLSDSVDHLSEAQADGELPAVTVLSGQAGSGRGEGTAMLEIVHDLAPGAALYFATGVSGEASFAQNIRGLLAAGCRIIVDDVTYFSEPPFQDGIIAQAVNDVSAAGALYFSSAGNWGSKLKGTSSTWEGDFVDGGPATLGRGGRVHNFGGITYDQMLGGGFGRLDLFWADPLGSSTNDYDLYILDDSGAVLSSSTNIQDGNDDPYENIPVVSSGGRVVIVKYSGESRYLFLSAAGAPLVISTTGSVRGHNASGATNAFCVAATRVASPPVPFSGGSTNPVEFFSADGPRRIFFTADGAAVTPGDYSSTGGVDLPKPDITAADGVTTSVPGFAPFLGTSAAAPHAAAIAALLWSYNLALTPAEIRSLLTSTALDTETNGVDINSGAGIVMAYPAVAASPPQPRLTIQSVQLDDANTNGTLDASECADLVITLQNQVAANYPVATGVTAVLTTTTPGVLVDPQPHAYPDLPPGGSAPAFAPFRISTSPLFLCSTSASFTLRVGTSNEVDFSLPLAVASGGGAGIGQPTNFVATAVPVDIPDLGTAESPLTVAGVDLPLVSVKVAVYITHTSDYDLRLSLIAPDGTTVVLSANNGIDGQNYGAGCDIPTVFTDDAITNITAGTPPYLGSFRPQQPLSALNGKSGSAVNGIWKLRVEDQVALDTGTLQCWTLQLLPATCIDDGGQCLLPPAVTQAPASQTATNHDTVVLTGAAQGTDPLTYQWYFDQTNLLFGATNTSLVLTNVSPGQSGNYALVVTNVYGSATSAPAALTVIVPAAIISSPADRTATNGDTVVFAALTEGTAPVSYQWYFDETNPVAGATSDSLVLTNVTPAETGTYTLAISNAFGSASSVPAQLTVVVPAAILGSPASQLATNGDTVQLSVLAQGTQPLTFQWYYNQTNPIAGATDDFLSLTNVSPADSGSYTVVVTNAYASVTSAPAQLLVVVPAAILLPPAGVVATNGDNVAFNVTATGTLPLSYQWYFNQTNVLAGATDAALVLSNVTPAQAGSYLVSVSNSYGQAAASASLTVIVLETLTCASNRTVELGTPWDFDPPTVTGSNVTAMILDTATNASCGDSFTATRAWLASDGGGFQATCTQTVAVVDTTPPVVTCPNNKTVVYPADWNFDAPSAHDAGVLDTVVYDNTAYDLATRFDPGSLEVGNEIILGDSPRYASRFSFEFWGTSEDGVSFAGNVQVRLRFYRMDGPISSSGYTSPHTLIYDSGPFPIPVTPRASLVYEEADFQANAVVPLTTPLPLSFTWTVQFTGLGSNDAAGLDLYAPPVVGATYTDYWEDDTNAWELKTNSLVPVELGARLEAVSRGTTITLVSTVTNAGPGVTLSATRTWQATDACSNSTYCSQTVNVVDTRSPTIVSQPEDQILMAGDTATFPVTATGGPPLSYQWFFNQTNQLVESTNATLVLSNLSLADAGSYSVIVSNPYGITTSDPAQLIVLSPPVILSAPTNQLATNGDTVQLMVLAQGTDPLAYQWLFNDTNLLTDATNDLLVLSNVAPAEAGAYSVTITNLYGVVTSTPAQLSVVVPAALLSSPTDQVATNGDTVQFTVVAQGTEPLVYRWYFQGTQLLAGAVGPALVLSNVTPAQAGPYGVVVSNAYGQQASSPASLIVLTPPAVLAQPLQQTVARGGNATFAVVAAGNPSPAYQWLFDTTNVIAGATDNTLTLTNVQDAEAGSYSVLLSNFLGTAVSLEAALIIGQPPSVLTQPTNFTVAQGGTAQFSITATGTPPLHFQWFFTNPVPGGTTATLTLTNLTAAQSGSYSVIVSNAFGSEASQPAVLRVLVPPNILRIGRTGNIVTLTFSTVTNLLYTVESQESLQTNLWQVIPKGLQRPGSGAPLSLQDARPAVPQRYYRVVVE